MITKDNFKKVLTALGFTKASMGEFYSISYGDCLMCVDFDNATLIYPEAKGLVVNDKTTSNFSHNENFVVFECVCRLLNKGYRPEHIELEPRWTLGHEQKSGKADIVVKGADGEALIIIECKTAGAEYNKEKKQTEEDGGQLFSYWQQITSAKWLALYASDWKDGELIVKSDVIHAEDDANIAIMAKKDRDIRIYAQSHEAAKRFEVWQETYNQAWYDNIIFDEDSTAYNVGIPPLRKSKLRDFTPDDKIVNRFEEILRHNNISDKENAFNRLVALFICKLVDEMTKEDYEEVDFQYKQGTDTYETLQDRLQRLHKQGMEEFMREKIFYVDGGYAERLFKQYTGANRKKAIEDLKHTIRALKFYSNNDFAFKDVHNEELFYQNGKALVEVVELFQPYRIVYASKHQFLGDLFEQLLNKGFKQNEGQFFTPMPITRFIWDSLPVESYISEHGLPRVIDYACGAGHFLTEAVEAVNAVRKESDNRWTESHIYGIEKDYRLARVSKISMFMNGAGGANIIFGDGLENYADKHIQNGEFDILVANPPYSVSGFKAHLKLRNNDFAILDKITNTGSEIETLFVERTAQLLRSGGMAAVVLPASVLSNASSSYMAAREEILKNFYLRAVVSFGSKTFGATGTNTVTLFMERYTEPPRIAELTQDSVEAVMSGDEISDFSDRNLLNAYLAHQGVSEEDWRAFVCRSMADDAIAAHAYFKVYTDAFLKMPLTVPKRLTAEEQIKYRQEKFYDWALAIERDKLYYFALTFRQQTLVITAPSDNKEQKTFLGYDWSNRKGNEGIVINIPGGKLYNHDDRFARGTLSSAIRNSFAGASSQLPEDIQQYAKTYVLKDMLDFSRDTFDKGIALSAKAVLEIHSKYKIVDLSQFAINISKGQSITRSSVMEGEYKVIAGGKDFAYMCSEFNREPDVITISGSGANAGYVNIWHEKIFASDCTTVKGSTNTETMYIYYFLKSIQDHIYTLQKGSAQPHVYPKDIEKLQVPLPPISIQQQIVDECAKIDEEYNTSRMAIETYRQKIEDIFDELEVVNKSKMGGVKISKLCHVKGGKRIPKGMGFTSEKTSHPYLRVSDFKDNSIDIENLEYISEEVYSRIERYTISADDVYISIAGTIGVVGQVPEILDGANLTENAAKLVIKDKNAIMPKYLVCALQSKGVKQQIEAATHAVGVPKLAITRIEQIVIPIATLEEQQKVVTKVTHLEAKIEECKLAMLNCDMKRNAVLSNYLN